LEKSNRELIENLKETVESTMTSEENAKRMEAFFLEARQQELDLNAEIKKRSEFLFKASQETQKCRQEQDNLESEVNGCEATLKSLENRINRLDHDSLKQAEAIYEQDFKIQTLERRLNRLRGEKSNDELLALEKRIAVLKKSKEERIIQRDTLQNQYKRVEEEKRKTSREIEDLNKQRAAIDTKLAELTLWIDTAQKLLDKSIGQKQDIMVNENLKKLELNKLRDLLDKRADDVLALNKERIKLESGMKERFAEIELHQELLRTQLRAWTDELQTVSYELKERAAKVEKLHKRYEIAMISMAPPEGAAPEESSQAYYVIKAAQEKEELQREGDELDAKIKKAEKELRAAETTLVVINSNNQSYKHTYGKADGQSNFSFLFDKLNQIKVQWWAFNGFLTI
jgi:UDP-glucose:O-linked fucose beta-1,3-glucosyltransferase